MEERRFYCEKIQHNCPFDSRFRYCFDCEPVQELADDYDDFDISSIPPASLFEYEED